MPKHEESKVSRRSGHVLIVDDEEFIRTSFKLYFETIGFHVSTADGGESALKIFQHDSSQIDVVLLDLVMPGTHGIEVLRRLKEIDASVEVIIATGCGNMNTAIQALRYGAFDYVTKPIVNFEEDLLRVVEDALRARRSEAAGSRAPKRKIENCPGLFATQDCLHQLEELANHVRSAPRGPAAMQVVGAFLSECLGAAAAIVFRQRDTEHLACLAQWGDFDSPGSSARAFTLLQAAAIAATLSEKGAWQALDPEVSSFASCSSTDEAAPVQALLLPLDFGVLGQADDAYKLLVLRQPDANSNPEVAVPALLSLVLSEAVGRQIEESESVGLSVAVGSATT